MDFIPYRVEFQFEHFLSVNYILLETHQYTTSSEFTPRYVGVGCTWAKLGTKLQKYVPKGEENRSWSNDRLNFTKFVEIIRLKSGHVVVHRLKSKS